MARVHAGWTSTARRPGGAPLGRRVWCLLRHGRTSHRARSGLMSREMWSSDDVRRWSGTSRRHAELGRMRAARAAKRSPRNYGSKLRTVALRISDIVDTPVRRSIGHVRPEYAHTACRDPEEGSEERRGERTERVSQGQARPRATNPRGANAHHSG